MFLIAGLGNPTKEYEHTRHNVGFDTIDVLAERCHAGFRRSRFNALVAKCTIGGETGVLVKPLTYMNLSGEAVGKIARFYKVENAKVLIIYDDTDLDVGRIRVRMKGSAGGHNGMKSIIAHLGGENFARVRIGIGKRGQMDMVDFVLGWFSKEERLVVEEAMERAASAAEDFVTNGIDHAMNRYNA